jgi:hypothetical protein
MDQEKNVHCKTSMSLLRISLRRLALALVSCGHLGRSSIVQYEEESQWRVVCSIAQPMTKSRFLPRFFFFWRSSMTLGAPLASAPRRHSANHTLLDNAPPPSPPTAPLPEEIVYSSSTTPSPLTCRLLMLYDPIVPPRKRSITSLIFDLRAHWHRPTIFPPKLRHILPASSLLHPGSLSLTSCPTSLLTSHCTFPEVSIHLCLAHLLFLRPVTFLLG